MGKGIQASVSLLTLVSVLTVSACAGRTPNPVAEYKYGDEKKSCSRLQAEISNTEAEITAKLPAVDKTGSNVALGVAGAFLLVPWFFMDFSEADRVEVEALRRRYNNLVGIAADKDCGFENEPLPAFEKPETKAAEKDASY